MSLKRQHSMMAAFSMASMTDVIFLLLVFFLVTSTFIFPTALDINLPESAAQTPSKPTTRVFIDQSQQIYISTGDTEPEAVEDLDRLLAFLQLAARNNPEDYIAVYADAEVTYGRLVEVLDLGARNNLKMVLATKPAPASAMPATATDTDEQP